MNKRYLSPWKSVPLHPHTDGTAPRYVVVMYRLELGFKEMMYTIIFDKAKYEYFYPYGKAPTLKEAMNMCDQILLRNKGCELLSQERFDKLSLLI